jgi:NAD(P)-dependent dehydrogenase (short-subunit alcohol dehydrogenase family)
MDKIAIVTGAGSGIGKAIALRLAKDGNDVVVADVDLEGARQTATGIEALGRRAQTLRTDVTKSGEVNEMVKAALKEFRRIDILVNNAGGSAGKRQALFHQLTEEAWDYVMALNLKGVFNCCRAVIGTMMEQRSGKIINIGSVSGLIGHAGMVDYSTAKAGVVGFTMALAKEAAAYGINVNCVSPGPIETPGVLQRQSPEGIERVKKSTGLGRFGRPEEIAAMVSFLASNEADFITGQTVAVCGIRNLGA